MIDLATLKLHLKVDPDITVDDPLIIAMEEAAVAYIQNETGRYYGESGEITEVLSAFGWGPITLQTAPEPDSIYTPITVEKRTLLSGDWEVVDAADYEIDGNRLFPRVFWTPGARTIRITYTGGYDEGAEPADIQQAVRELVARMYKYRLPFVEGSVLAELPASVSDVIRAHRVVVF